MKMNKIMKLKMLFIEFLNMDLKQLINKIIIYFSINHKNLIIT